VTTAPTEEPNNRPRLHAVPDDEPAGRTPPQDVAAEQCVLGAMLLSKDAIADVVDILQTSDFYQPRHAVIFDAILDMYGRGEPADIITVTRQLVEAGNRIIVNDPTYLHTLTASVPTVATAASYARIVAERAVDRRLVEASVKVNKAAWGDGPTMDRVEQAQQAVFEVAADNASKSEASFLADVL
jgi:replicative DNA helicase